MGRHLERAFAATVLLLGAGAAHAVMPPEVYRRARAEAPFHVQVEIDKISVPAETPGGCTVSGKIVSIFRDTPGALSTGEEVTFPVECTRAGDTVPIGGTLWENADALESARFIEVYLEPLDAGFVPVLYQSQTIDAPSETPRLPVD